MDEIDYEIKRTILHDLQEECRRVKIKCRDGTEVIGKTDIIVWEDVDPEDDDSYDEYEVLRFLPEGQKSAMYFQEEEIESYEVLES